jgi:hypothetical protein
MPREHGAWGILLIPFATAVGASGVWNARLALLLGSVVSFYLARASWRKRDRRWLVIWLAASALGAAMLIGVWQLWWLALFGAAAAPLAFRRTERSLAGQLAAVAGLTMTAPAAWYVATGQFDHRLWALNALYFAGGVLYVKMHLATAIAREATARWPVLGYHGALAGVAAATWPVGLALLPAVARAVVGVLRLEPRLRIKRLGWTEVGHSVVFGLLVIGLARI